jgi:hypothetical protein
MSSNIFLAELVGSYLFKKNTPDDIPTNKFIGYFLEASFPLACEKFQNHRERPEDSLEIPGDPSCFSDCL